ncbi:MAG TPA: cytochrome c peroxidase [Stellaceae bacterium]|jgi:cytochrome c peroxidase
MRRDTRALVKAAFATVLGVLCVPLAGSEAHARPAYNPYPSGILPANLDSEITRVRNEVQTIFGRYFSEYQALTPTLTYSGNPPILVPNGYDAQRILGGLLNFDENMSPFHTEACSFCHMPYAAFSGPIQSVNLTMIAYPGSAHYRAAKRTAQRYTYSHTFPVLNYDPVQGLFFGGNFWDGRATGMKLQAPDAEQAQGPPVDPLEMGFPDIACIAWRLSQASYRPLFELVWGTDFDINWPSNTEKVCSTPNGAFGSNTTPVALSAVDRTKATNIYDHWGESLSFLERSPDISPFNSKFDWYLKNPSLYPLTADEMAGYKLFNGKGNCNSCHLDGRSTTLTPGETDTGNTADVQPLFTCHGFANEGLPLNPRIALFYENKPDPYGFTPNPDGLRYRDLGLGNFLRSGPQSFPDPNQPEWLSLAPSVDGQMQVMTARDVALTPPQCPTTEAGTGKPYFQKEFFHNGYIKSLKQLVHFYNTRDTSYAYPVTSGHCPAGTVERVTCWPQPEVKNNLDMTTGALGLTDTEENQIVAFLETLTDGYNPANPTVSTYKNIDTFTGQCSITTPGETASNQGDKTLIPTWNLAQFPCATDICGVPPLPTTPIP